MQCSIDGLDEKGNCHTTVIYFKYDFNHTNLTRTPVFLPHYCKKILFNQPK
jgi:hypothetical protein